MGLWYVAIDSIRKTHAPSASALLQGQQARKDPYFESADWKLYRRERAIAVEKGEGMLVRQLDLAMLRGRSLLPKRIHPSWGIIVDEVL